MYSSLEYQRKTKFKTVEKAKRQFSTRSYVSSQIIKEWRVMIAYMQNRHWIKTKQKSYFLVNERSSYRIIDNSFNLASTKC